MDVEKIIYSVDGADHEGALVYDKSVSKPRPALLMAPNYLGMSDKALDYGRRMAGDRYVVFVADMYGKGKSPAGREQAMPMATEVRADAAMQRRRIRAAYDTMLAEVDSRKLGDGHILAAGFCFGGGNVLELARDGAKLDGVATFHGELKTRKPAEPGAIVAPILVLTGAADPVVPAEDRQNFEKEMVAAGAKWQMLLFSGVVHSFTDPSASNPQSSMYNESAARQSFTLFHQFMDDAMAGRL